jgi:hypothetical protein
MKKQKSAQYTCGVPAPAGTRFGRLVVVEVAPSIKYANGNLARRVVVRCDCGAVKTVHWNNLFLGKTASCGGHGGGARSRRGIDPRIYSVRNGMLQRCYNPNSPSYHRYGGRGISVCDEWRRNPSEFAKWATANGYERGLQIDRRDNDGNYCPSNCRFVTRAENCRNTNGRKIHPSQIPVITGLLNGGATGRDVAKLYGVHESIISRIKNGHRTKHTAH